jgi:hypothetical protein
MYKQNRLLQHWHKLSHHHGGGFVKEANRNGNLIGKRRVKPMFLKKY